MGDSGWAGQLAYAFLSRPRVPVYLVYEPGMPVLKLLLEASALLPVERRWHVTFNTYYSTLPAGTTCCWRCCVPDNPCIAEARRDRRTLVIDLRQQAECTADNSLVHCARDGTPQEQLRGENHRIRTANS